MGYTLKRRCNNNVVEAIDAHGRSVVVTGRGVGFRVNPGQQVPPERIQLTYVLESQQRAGKIADALALIPADVLAVARKIVIAAQDRFGLNPVSMLLPFAEHLAFALRRARDGQDIDVPLAFEVAQLYPEEHEFGRFALKVIRADLGVDIHPSEATAFALHVVSAQFTCDRIASAVRMTQDIGGIVKLVERHLAVRLDPAAAGTARFITHVRYLLAGFASGRRCDREPVEVIAVIQQSLAASWRVAEIVAEFLIAQQYPKLSEAEIGFLALHISRLR